MFFKKYLKKYISKNPTETEQQTKQQTEQHVNLNEDVSKTNPFSESSEDTADQSLFGYSILFGKMKNHTGPDMLYDNEAWAPENEYIGLFHKRRAQFEDQTSNTVTE